MFGRKEKILYNVQWNDSLVKMRNANRLHEAKPGEKFLLFILHSDQSLIFQQSHHHFEETASTSSLNSSAKMKKLFKMSRWKKLFKMQRWINCSKCLDETVLVQKMDLFWEWKVQRWKNCSKCLETFLVQKMGLFSEWWIVSRAFGPIREL